MAQAQHTPQRLLLLKEAFITLFCEIDHAYTHLNPKGQYYATLKRLSDSQVLTLALFSSSFEECNPNLFTLRETARLFSHLFPGVLGLHPSFTAAFASSDATSWNPCGAPFCPSSWWESLRL